MHLAAQNPTFSALTPFWVIFRAKTANNTTKQIKKKSKKVLAN